jgi:hypothetical protein
MAIWAVLGLAVLLAVVLCGWPVVYLAVELWARWQSWRR